MTAIADICVYTHNHSHLMGECLHAIGDNTDGSYNIVVLTEPGTCHENSNRALRQATSRYVVLMDEDVLAVQPSWLKNMVLTLERNEDYGAVCTLQRHVDAHELHNPDDRAVASYVERHAPRGGVVQSSWLPGHTVMYDRERWYPAFDEEVPGRYGMSDVDVSYQCRFGAGLKVGHAVSSFVLHRNKRTFSQEHQDSLDFPRESEDKKFFPLQLAYLQKKWSRPLYFLNYKIEDEAAGGFMKKLIAHQAINQTDYGIPSDDLCIPRFGGPPVLETAS